MPTKTLFQTLQFGDNTFTIEVVAPTQDEDTLDLTTLPPDEARKTLPADPWGNAPLLYTRDGTAIYSPTRVLPQLNGTYKTTTTADRVVYVTGKSSGRE